MLISLKINAIPVRCHRCSHEWYYKGKNDYAVCPNCRTTITVSKCEVEAEAKSR